MLRAGHRIAHHGLDRRIGPVGSAHDAALAEMNLGKLGVGVGKLQLDRARSLAPAAPDFGERVFEAIDHTTRKTILSASNSAAIQLIAEICGLRHTPVVAAQG